VAKRGKTKTPGPVEIWPKVFETFALPYSLLSDVTHRTYEQPSVCNGDVRVTRYRITVEKVEEPIEIIADRLRQLWRQSNHHHEWWPLKEAAKKHGITLIDAERGADAPSRPY
jgi:hypothetical protein